MYKYRANYRLIHIFIGDGIESKCSFRRIRTVIDSKFLKKIFLFYNFLVIKVFVKLFRRDFFIGTDYNQLCSTVVANLDYTNYQT